MPNIVVVGASQGGVHALRTLFSRLPKSFPAPIMAVLHVGSEPSILPSILNDVSALTASHAQDGDVFKPGHIYIAPPDHHLLVMDGHLELSRGPRENWARPAIDPLFRSAAEAYGPSVIGVVLTGKLNDGTPGLYEIKRRGGITIVQDPSDAEAPSMPSSALQNVQVDYSLPLNEIPPLLVRLVEEIGVDTSTVRYGAPAMDHEERIVSPTAQTCPECGGAMAEEALGTLTRFRCHIGHVMTAEILAATQLDKLDNTLSSALRMLNERAGLCRDIGAKHSATGSKATAQAWHVAAVEAESREEAIKNLIHDDWQHPEVRSGK